MPESLSATFTADTSKLEEVLASLSDALGAEGKVGDAADCLRDETRRLVVEMVKDTPPQTKQFGEAAVDRDLNRIFSGATPKLIDDIGSQYGLTHVDTWITDWNVDSKGFGAKTHLLWDRIDPEGARMDEFHGAFQDAKGRVSKGQRGVKGVWVARVVVPHESKTAYADKIKERVGIWKASFAETAIALGVTRVAGWIKRHVAGASSPKGFHDISGLMNGSTPSVTFGSRAPGVMRLTLVYQAAVNIRAKAIKRRLELIASGYAKDVANRMKISRKENRSGNGGRYSIG